MFSQRLFPLRFMDFRKILFTVRQRLAQFQLPACIGADILPVLAGGTARHHSLPPGRCAAVEQLFLLLQMRQLFLDLEHFRRGQVAALLRAPKVGGGGRDPFKRVAAECILRDPRDIVVEIGIARILTDLVANPLVGAAVGAGSLLAQSVLKDPIEQFFSYQYTVTGGWSDPVVTRGGTATASVAPGPKADGMTR